MKKFQDQYDFTVDLNRRFAKQNLTRLVHTNARFEGVNTTLAQTQTIIDGMGVAGVSVRDIDIIKLLKQGWELIVTSDEPVSLELAKQINAIVARDEALFPGEFRTGRGSVTLTSGAEFVPPLVDLAVEQAFFEQLLNDPQRSATDQALTLMYHLMRNQLFWDGNKRTATLLANKWMIDHGAGLINVPLDRWGEWNELISNYYESGDMTTIKEWTYQYGIQGIEMMRAAR